MELMEKIVVGMKAEQEFLVEEQYTAGHVGSGSLRVLATPSLIGFMEHVASDLMQRNLPDGYSSVGAWVDVRHLAPTPLGHGVTCTARVIQTDGKLITFQVEAADEQELIARGLHKRAIIEVERFAKRVAQKQGKS